MLVSASIISFGKLYKFYFAKTWGFFSWKRKILLEIFVKSCNISLVLGLLGVVFYEKVLFGGVFVRGSF